MPIRQLCCIVSPFMKCGLCLQARCKECAPTSSYTRGCSKAGHGHHSWFDIAVFERWEKAGEL